MTVLKLMYVQFVVLTNPTILPGLEGTIIIYDKYFSVIEWVKVILVMTFEVEIQMSDSSVNFKNVNNDAL